MWVEKTKQGTFKFLERYRCPITNKIKRTSVTMKSDSRQAVKQASTLLAIKIKELTTPVEDRITPLSDIMEKYFTYKKNYVKPITLENNKASYAALAERLPKNVTVQQLTTAIIQKALDEFSATHSYSYSQKLLSILRQGLQFAKRRDLISSYAFLDDVCIERKPITRKEIEKRQAKYLEPDELSDVLERINKIAPEVALILEFQSLTGLRYGELAALRYEDCGIDFIDVNGSYYDGVRSTPKNTYSYRKVTLSNRAIQILQQYISMSKARKKWSLKSKDTEYVFTNSHGVPYDVRYINKIIKKIGYHKPISTHTFRHTHISLLAAANVPIKAIMERVGHNEPRTTLAVYTHVTEDAQRKLKATLEDIL